MTTSNDTLSRILKDAEAVEDWGSALPGGHPLRKIIFGPGIDSYNRITNALDLFRTISFNPDPALWTSFAPWVTVGTQRQCGPPS